jgi:drug/metabolite transporter (DMT)-like permease
MIKNIVKKYEHSNAFLLVIGLLAAFFFSVTFLINRSISLEGGHWYWSASLRYVYTIVFLGVGLLFFRGVNYLVYVLQEFKNHLGFWTLSGSIGFGSFYGFLCFSADFSPAWVVATTWQMTIIASLFVLWAFGQKLPKSIWVYTTVIFVGISCVNLSHFDISDYKPLLLGFFPVLIAAFSYPLGNQMVWMTKKKRYDRGDESVLILNNAFVKVFLLTLGSYPVWIVLFFLFDVSTPSSGQLMSVASVALLSGVIATTLFLYARNKANTPSKLMLVDATQSGEVAFALLGEVMFLGASLPSLMGVVGIIITIIGLIAIVKR